MLSKFGESAAIVGSCVLVILLGLFGYFSFLDGTVFDRPIIYWQGSFQVLDQPLHPGDPVKIVMYATKYRPIIPDVNWSIRNKCTNQTWQFKKQGSTTVGWNEYKVAIAVVPDEATPCADGYGLDGITTYDLGVRKVSIPMRGTDFMVELKNGGSP